MAEASVGTKQDLLDATVELAIERFTKIDAPTTERLIRNYYERAAPQDLDGKTTQALYAAALRHWQLADRRDPGEALIRVYNPDPDDDGWVGPHTVIDVVVDDMPFIVDSVTALMETRSLNVHVLIHPMATVERTDSGEIISIHSPRDTSVAGQQESFLHIEVDRLATAAERNELAAQIQSVLDDVRAAVEDWQPMRHRAIELADDLEDRGHLEEAALLRWMAERYFTFIGYREYDHHGGEDPRIVSRPRTGLGILRQSETTTRSLRELPPEIAARAAEPTTLNLTKANSISTVHRAVPLDYVGVKEIDADGVVVGERRFLGLFTSDVYAGRVEDIPVVREKVAAVIERSGFRPDSHDGSRLLNILQRYPRDELFQISLDDLERNARAILDLRDRRQVALLVRRDVFGRFLSCLVFVPRDRHTTDVRLRIQEILVDAYDGIGCRFSTEISDAPLARLHIVVFTRPTPADQLPDAELVRSRVARVIRTWDDDLREALVEAHGEDIGLALNRRYAYAFSSGYRDHVRADAAVSDIVHLENLDGRLLDVHLYHPIEAAPTELRCKLYRTDEPVTLSEIVPVFQDLGATVIDERPYEIRLADLSPRFIYDIGLDVGNRLDADGRARFVDALLAVWRGEAETDGFARLVTCAGLDWRDVVVLRAYSRYLVQIGLRFTPDYVQDTLSRNPEITSGLMELFAARFSPERQPDNRAERDRTIEHGLRAQLDLAIDDVASLDEDRILRAFRSLIEATVRTNRYLDRNPVEQSQLALKLDPSHIRNVPPPVPASEIFVYGPRTEGVHLRAGPVARGGIRWSDRRDDYRTEILGLMKAQAVKNSVIVPVGAKGGFIAKRGEVVSCYRSFIGSLLDVVDNVGTDPPPAIVRYDGNDTYLVVAADKGTATFSDLANEMAVERGFWLGDAFASGGSTGYDHKKLGITARGAWCSVERHFRELGTDITREDFTVVGIGDMSGDVFGNGMLLSEHIRLVAAFDHRHIFLDPDPDPAASFAERKRLFELDRSTWADYRPDLISTGGGVHARTEKSITLSEQVQRALGTDETAVTPAALIRLVLAAPVDLLWNGGVGTYVKATDERPDEVGDRSNDAVRMDAHELRCRVVAEGGNLGLTQRARVELARAGVRLNTDAIDNSAGVDCSDHEVNLKILLAQAVGSGELTEKQRNELLASMADEVCELVLANNYAQNETLAAARAQAPGMVEVHARHLSWLAGVTGLDRGLEALPSDELLAERAQLGEGLTTPELAVLLAHTKNGLTASLQRADLAADPTWDATLLAYFPEAVRNEFPDLIRDHPLRRELLATLVANQLVNRGGISMVHRLAEETSAIVADIARAHAAAWKVYDLEPLWMAVRKLDNEVRAGVQTTMQLEIKRLGERAARWFLRKSGPQSLAVDDIVARYADIVRAFAEIIPAKAQPDTSSRPAAAAQLEDEGVPPDLAQRIGSLGLAFGALDLSEVAMGTGANLDRVADAYFGLEERLDLGWLRQQIIALPRDDHWQTLARSALRDEFFRDHAALTAVVVEEGVEHWWQTATVGIERYSRTIDDIKVSGVNNLAQVSVAVRTLRQLTGA